jgi:AraC-like DNA-binding protein/DNA-binding NarL/FixJ family response regulator
MNKLLDNPGLGFASFPSRTAPQEMAIAGLCAHSRSRLVAVEVAHRQPLVRAGLMALLSVRAEWGVVAGNIDETAIAERPAPRRPASGSAPSILVADYATAMCRLAEPAGHELAPGPDRVLVVTRRQGEAEVSAALALGARGYVTIDSPVAELVAAVEALVRGERFLCRALWHSGSSTAGPKPGHSHEDRLLRTLTASSQSNQFSQSGLGGGPPRGGLAPGALRRVRDHVEQRLSDKIELRDLAALSGLSECHFARAFKQSTGLPPHRYLMVRRVAKAADLIKTSDRPLSEVGLDAGFADQSHFTRVFLATTGETPRAYRHRHR